MPPALPRYVRTVHTSVADPDPNPAIFGCDKSPYTFPGGVAKIVNKNAARVAEVACDPDPWIRTWTNGSGSGSCYFFGSDIQDGD
jgi:hypothetical protein